MSAKTSDREFLRELGASTLKAVSASALARWLQYKLNTAWCSLEMNEVEDFALRCRRAIEQ
jgi:hypothetical protein